MTKSTRRATPYRWILKGNRTLPLSLSLPLSLCLPATIFLEFANFISRKKRDDDEDEQSKKSANFNCKQLSIILSLSLFLSLQLALSLSHSARCLITTRIPNSASYHQRRQLRNSCQIAQLDPPSSPTLTAPFPLFRCRVSTAHFGFGDR